MRIAMVTDGAVTGRDSSDLAAALTGLGHDVDIHDAPRDRRGSEATAWFAQRWRRTAPEVVHSRSRVAGEAAVHAARAVSVPVVHCLRPADGAPTSSLERDIALSADRVVASCVSEMRELVTGRVPRSRISVVPFGVDVEHFTPDGDHPPIGDRYRVVAVGDLTRAAGFATAVAALGGLPGTELVIAGHPHNGNHAKELRDYARRLGVSDRLRLPGPVTRALLPSLLRSADVVLCTPWRPRFDITAVEAAACGVAVVASNTGGLADTVVDHLTGLLVAPHRPRELAAAVWELLSQPLRREQYGATSRDRACSRYSWHQIAVDTVNAYHLARTTTESQGRNPSRRRN